MPIADMSSAGHLAEAPAPLTLASRSPERIGGYRTLASSYSSLLINCSWWRYAQGLGIPRSGLLSSVLIHLVRLDVTLNDLPGLLPKFLVFDSNRAFNNHVSEARVRWNFHPLAALRPSAAV